MLNWSRGKIMFCALTVLFSTIFIIQVFTVDAKNVDLVKISTQDDVLVINVLIPQFKNMNSAEFERTLNEEIKAKVASFVEEVRRGAVQGKIEDVQKYPYVVDISAEVVFETEEIISLVVYYYQFTGGAHGLTTFETYNVDVKNCRLLSLEDILVSEAESIIKDEIVIQIQSQEESFFEDAESKVKQDNIFKRAFLIRKEGLVVKYPLYEIAPYASGMPEFVIDWGRVRKYLKLDISLR